MTSVRIPNNVSYSICIFQMRNTCPEPQSVQVKGPVFSISKGPVGVIWNKKYICTCVVI